MPYFPPLPKVPDIDFRPWTTYQSQAHVVELYGNPPNKPAQAWADWLSKTEQYLLQENPSPSQGRGYQLQVVTKPLVSQAKARTWRKGRLAFWEQLRAVLQLALQQPATTSNGPVQGYTQRIRHAHRHWVYGLQPGGNSLMQVIIGIDTGIPMQLSYYFRQSIINFRRPNRRPMKKRLSNIDNGYKKDTKKASKDSSEV